MMMQGIAWMIIVGVSVVVAAIAAFFVLWVFGFLESKDKRVRKNMKMKVRLVKPHSLKAHDFFEKNQGKIFEVIKKFPNGYDIDLTPAGDPGECGFVYREEVEEVPDWEIYNEETYQPPIPYL